MKASVRSLRMKYQCISIKLRAMTGCRNGAEGVGGGSLKSADYRPPNWRPAAAPQPGGWQLRGVANQHAADASWWPGAHTSAPKAPSTYAAEFRSEVSQGLGWVGKKQISDCCAGVVQVGNAMRRQVDDERSRRERKAGIALTLRNPPR